MGLARRGPTRLQHGRSPPRSKASLLRADVIAARCYGPEAAAAGLAGSFHLDAAPGLAAPDAYWSAAPVAPPPRPAPRLGRPVSAPSFQNHWTAADAAARAAPFDGQRLHASAFARKADAALQTPAGSFLRICGLGQYAGAFATRGLQELDAIVRLPDDEALSFLDCLQLFPGHRAKLLRAMTMLRQVAIHSSWEQGPRRREENLLERLCERGELLALEKKESEAQSRLLQEENHRLMAELERARTQRGELERSQKRVHELEELVQNLMGQVGVLAQQMAGSRFVGREVTREAGAGDRNAPTSPGGLGESAPDAQANILLEARGSKNTSSGLSVMSTAADWRPESPMPGDSRATRGSGIGAGNAPMPPGALRESASVVQANTLPDARRSNNTSSGLSAMSTAAKWRQESPALGDSLPSDSRGNTMPVRAPHSHSESALVEDEDLDSMAIATAFALERLMAAGSTQPAAQAKDLEISATSAVFLHCRSAGAFPSRDEASSAAASLQEGERGDSEEAAPYPPSKWEMCEFVLDLLVTFELHGEVAVIALLYLMRFSERSGVAFAPDNWCRLTIVAMLLAWKVWDEDAFDNAKLAEISDMYTEEELDTFERVFTQGLCHDLVVKKSDYKRTHFFVQTSCGSESAMAGLPQLSPDRAVQLRERYQRQAEPNSAHAN